MLPRPLLLGHRGARRHAPENTLDAFDLCLDHGCDGFEFDVRLCADARAVICHDPRFGRQEIAKTKFTDLAAPSLENVFTRYAHRAFLDIELKVPGLESIVLDLVRAYPPQVGYYVSSFLPGVIADLHRRNPTLRLGLICDSRAQFARWTAVPASALFLERSLCTAAVVDALHSAGKQVFVWTVNREYEMRVFAETGVDGIISDDTALLVKVFESGGAPDHRRLDEKR